MVDPSGDSVIAYQIPPDVELAVREKIAGRKYASGADVLWDALRALKDQAAEIAAAREAIADFEAGDRSASNDEFVARF